MTRRAAPLALLSLASALSLPPTCRVVRERRTGCDVLLVGCLHGAPSSEADVEAALAFAAASPAPRACRAVVLELCPERWRTLEREMAATAAGESPALGDAVASTVRSVRAVSRAARRESPVGAGVFSALALVSLLQRWAIDYDPAREFKAAARAARAGGLDIVLGDRPLVSTMRRFGASRASPGRATRATRAGLGALAAALAGGDGYFARASVLNAPALRDLLRVLLPVTLATTLAAAALSAAGEAAFDAAAGGAAGTPAGAAAGAALGDAASVAILLASVALLGAFGEVVIRERDDVLAESVLRACRAHPGSTVVGVVGMLHVQGIVERVAAASDPLELGS